MLLLYRKNQELYVKVELDLRKQLEMQPEGRVYGISKHIEHLLPEEVSFLLTVNGNIRLWNGEKYIKLNLGQFYDVMKNKNYRIDDYVEPAKQADPVKEEPKKEVMKEEPVVIQPKIEENSIDVEEHVQQEVKQDQPKNNNNKKQRHNNNNKQNQGGDK